MGTSQLGGVVYGNPNLNQNADIILNEVGSTNEIMLTSFVSLAYKPSLSMIKSEVRSLLICACCAPISANTLSEVVDKSPAIINFKEALIILVYRGKNQTQLFEFIVHLFRFSKKTKRD
jgi:hypothetical protein